MFSPRVAEQLRTRGYDVVSVHDSGYSHLEGVEDAQLFATALTEGRALVTENVADFRMLETDAMVRGEPVPGLIFTTPRQFPRGQPATADRLVEVLIAILQSGASYPGTTFLKPTS